MNWDRIEGNWKQFKGKVKEQWGKLTDDDLDRIAGKRDQLVGKIQERYGIAKDEAEKQVDSWTRNMITRHRLAVFLQRGARRGLEPGTIFPMISGTVSRARPAALPIRAASGPRRATC